MEIIILYVSICYLFASIAAAQTDYMSWFMLLIAPVSVPITLAFVYVDLLKKTFG